MEWLRRILVHSWAFDPRPERLDDVLQMIVELVPRHLGFDTVVLRLFNKSGKNFETRTHIGVPREQLDAVTNYRIPEAEYQKITDPRNKVSKSYIIRAEVDEDHRGDCADGVIVENGWNSVEMLVVPMTDDAGDTVGFLTVENANGLEIAVGDVIESLEVMATLATIAIHNARRFADLQGKNEQMQAQADKITSLNKIRSDFVATISHEFRTPLASIKAYTETLLDNADQVDHGLLKQFLVAIDEESTRLMATVDEALDLSHLESGAMKFDRVECDVNTIVKQAAQDLVKHFETKQVTLAQDLPNAPAIVWAEGELIRQLVVRLLHNAAEFNHNGGKVWARVIDDVVAVRIIVEVEGNGIPDSELGKIFEQFYQVDNSNAGDAEDKAAGMGLAVCKNIVDWHDGRIWAENVPRSGARFVAVIPKKEVLGKCHSKDMCSAIRKFEVERFLELMVETAAELSRARRASIMIVDELGEMRIAGAVGINEDIVCKARVKVGESIAGRVAEEGKSWLVTDIENDPRVERANNNEEYEINTFMCVPLKCNDDVIGVINVSRPATESAFDAADLAHLEELASRMAIALAKLRVFAQASTEYEQVRHALKAILDSSRFIDRRNDQRLRDIIIRSARKLGLDDDEVPQLLYILDVYDLGLAKIGNHIVRKPTDLSPRERAEMCRHVELGANLVDAIETRRGVREIILHHHENYDGSGYPDGLSGELIPIESRIIRVADSLRALISKRSYQRQYSLDEAKEVLLHRAGSYFDPRVVNGFVEALDEYDSWPSNAAETDEATVQSP